MSHAKTQSIKDDSGHNLRNTVYRLEKNCAVVVFDGENPDGSLCSGNGKWATLFNEEDANTFVEDFSARFPDSTYIAFRLHQLGVY